MLRRFIAVMFVSSLGVAMVRTPAFAQPATASTATAADAAFQPIGRDFANLYQSLSNKGGVESSDTPVIEALRARVASFSSQFPNDPRGPKAELMLAKWLKDEAAVSQLFARVIQLEPENCSARMSWAKLLRLENKYPAALAAVGSYPPDAAKAPLDAMVYGDILFAEHRFAAAAAVYESIDAEPLGPIQVREIDEKEKQAREYQSLWEQEQSLRSQEEAADDLPRVILVTSRGPITLELFENQAPNTVANFINLAEKGFYNGTKFHRVITNFMAQGGDHLSKDGSTGTPGTGDPGYYIADEIDRPDHRMHFTGSLAMAKSEAPNTGGSQFYITVTPTPHLNGKHTVFGTVINGLETVRALRHDDIVESVNVIRKREHDYVPQTLPVTPPAVMPEPKSIDIQAEDPPSAPSLLNPN